MCVKTWQGNGKMLNAGKGLIGFPLCSINFCGAGFFKMKEIEKSNAG